MPRSLLALLVLILCSPAFGQGEKGKRENAPDDLPTLPEKLDKLSLTIDPGGHTALIEHVFFTPDSKRLISLGWDRAIRVWDVEDGKLVKTMHPPGYGPLQAAALSRDGKRLAVASAYPDQGKPSYKVLVLKLPEGQVERVLSGPTKTVGVLSFSGDGKRLASCAVMTRNAIADEEVLIWSLEQQEPPLLLKAKTKRSGIHDLALSRDGSRLFGVAGPAAFILDTTTGAELARMAGAGGNAPTQVAWSPDDKTLATSNFKNFQLWDSDGNLLNAHGAVLWMSFSSDAKSVLVGLDKPKPGRLRASLIDIATGKTKSDVSPEGTSAPKGIPISGAGHIGVLSPDGQHVACAKGRGSQGAEANAISHEIFIWKLADGAIVHRLGVRQWLRSNHEVVWSSNGKAVGWDQRLDKKLKKGELSFDFADLSFDKAIPDADRHSATLDQPDGLSLQPDGFLTYKVVEKGKELARIDHRVKGSRATLVGNDRAALATSDRITLYEARTGKELRKLIGFGPGLSSLAPSKDGRFLAGLSSGDQTLRIWNVERETPLLSLYVLGKEWIVSTPEGYYAASPNGEKFMGWTVDQGPDKMAAFYPADRFRKQFNRPDVIGRLLEFGSVEKALQSADKARGFKSTRSTVEEALPPLVTVTAPVSPKDAKITVQAKATPQGKFPITELQLLVDGRPHPEGLFPVKEAKVGPVETSWTIELPPGNEAHKVNVVARTSVSSGISSTLDLMPADAKAMLPSLHILSIGINSYGGDWKLHCATNDAKGIKEVFEQRSAAIYRGVNAKLLTDAEATKANILADLDALRKRVNPQDVAVIFFAGHGVKGKKGAFYLCPHGTDFADVEKTGISNDEIKKTLAKMQGRILVMLDACHSGASRLDEFARELTDDDCGVIVMCAAMGRETAGEEKKLGHGYFAKAVIDGLGGKADISRKDGQVYLHHLESYVIEAVQDWSKDEQHPVMSKPMSVRSFALAKPGK